MNSSPKRIVSLSPDSSDILCRLGAADRLVGVSAFAKLPKEFSGITRVSGFDSMNLGKVLSLKPDLVFAYSDVQEKFVRELSRKGINVVHTFQTSLREIEATIKLISERVNKQDAAEVLVKEFSRMKCQHFLKPQPKVYFEEWNEPLVAGIGWIGEMIELAGGVDLFSERRKCKRAAERCVDPNDVIQRNPDLILFSWCGKKGSITEIEARSGWHQITAVQKKQVVEIESSIILQPSTVLLEGFEVIRKFIADCR